MKLKEQLADSYWINSTACDCDRDHMEAAYLAGFEKAIELAATAFEGHNQTFSTDSDSVSFSYRVMQIVATLIRNQGEDEV